MGGQFHNFASFMRFLSPAGRGEINDQVRTGEQVFAAIGCTSCHIPVSETGANANPLFHRKQVALFSSDSLLHDVGTGDGIKQGTPRPMKSERLRSGAFGSDRPLLHDGTATLDEAIRRHGREASLRGADSSASAMSIVPRYLHFSHRSKSPAKAGHDRRTLLCSPASE